MDTFVPPFRLRELAGWREPAPCQPPATWEPTTPTLRPGAMRFVGPKGPFHVQGPFPDQPGTARRGVSGNRALHPPGHTPARRYVQTARPVPNFHTWVLHPGYW